MFRHRWARRSLWGAFALSALLVVGAMVVAALGGDAGEPEDLVATPPAVETPEATATPDGADAALVQLIERELAAMIVRTPLPHVSPALDQRVGSKISGDDGVITVQSETGVAVYARGPDGWALEWEQRVAEVFDSDSDGRTLVISDRQATTFYGREPGGWREMGRFGHAGEHVTVDGDRAFVANGSGIDFFERTGSTRSFGGHQGRTHAVTEQHPGLSVSGPMELDGGRLVSLGPLASKRGVGSDGVRVRVDRRI